MKNLYLISISLAMILVFISSVSRAATKTWNGSSSNNWNTAANWTPGGVPVANDDVIINLNAAIIVNANPATLRSLTLSGNATVSLTSSGGVRTLTLSRAGTSLTIQAGSTLSLRGSTGTGTRTMNLAFTGAGNTGTIAGTLIITDVQAGSTFTATNSTTTVTGTLKNDGSTGGTAGTITSTAANLLIAASGIYQHAINGSTIPTATWNAGSTCLITGMTGTDPNGDGQAFSNLTYDCAGMTGNRSMAASGLSISGNLSIVNTGSGQLQMVQTPLTIAGNCTINDNFRIGSGTAGTLTVSGNFTLSGGTLNMTDGASTGTLNVAGNFTLSGGTLTETGTNHGAVVFNGTGAKQTYISGSTVSNTINFTVNANANLQMAVSTTVVSGGGTFTLSAGGILGITSPNGIVAAVATMSGNIQTTTARTFNVAGTYIYNGTVNQVTGTGFPNNLTGSLTIDNPGNTVTLNNARIIANNGTVNLANGIFSTSQPLNMSTTSALNRSGGSMTGTPSGSGIYNVNYSGNTKTTGPELGGTGLSNVTVNLTPGQTLTLDQNRAPDGNLTVTAGSFDIGTFMINRSAPGGILTISDGAAVRIGGSHVFPFNYTTNTMATNSTVEFYGAAQAVAVQSYGNLVLSGSDVKSLLGNVTVKGELVVDLGPLLQISPVQQLTVNGNTTLNGGGSLVIQSDATGTGSFIDNGTIIYLNGGSASCQRYLTTNVWHYISPLISDATANIFFSDYLMTSDPSTTTGWSSWIVDPATPLQVVRGYACWKPSTNPGLETYTGSLNTGDKSISIGRTDTDPWAGWNMVGNPYPSCIVLSSVGIIWNSTEPTAYFWDGAVYQAYPVKAGYGTHSRYVAPGQGVYVHVIDTYIGTTTITLTNAARVHNSELFMKDIPDVKNGLTLKVQGNVNSYSDQITVQFDPEATTQYDAGYDAFKLDGISEAPNLYTKIGNTKVVCNCLPFEQRIMTIPMGFSCGLAGIYTLIANNLGSFEDGITITLEDMKLNTTQDIRSNPVYNFSYDPADDANRFILHFNNTTLGMQNQTAKENNVNAYSFGNRIYVSTGNTGDFSGNVYIYDLLGREMYQSKLSGNQLQGFCIPGLQGYYIVKVVSNQGTLNRKIFL